MTKKGECLFCDTIGGHTDDCSYYGIKPRQIAALKTVVKNLLKQRKEAHIELLTLRQENAKLKTKFHSLGQKIRFNIWECSRLFPLTDQCRYCGRADDYVHKYGHDEECLISLLDKGE